MSAIITFVRQRFIIGVLGIFMIAGILFSGCKPQVKSDTASTVQKGKLIRAEKIGEFDTAKLNRVFNEELEPFLDGSPMPFSAFKGKYPNAINSLTLYKITFQTSIPEKNNIPSEQTGLVAIPTIFAAGSPMVSYQHGTVFSKTDVPSNIERSMETKLMLARFGGQGYIVIAADYAGLGDSKENNVYYLRRSTEQTCMDMYAAAQEFLAQQKIKVGNFFTLGWSQGAYSTLVFLRGLEQAKIPVSATVTAATPADLFYVITHAVLNPRPIDASSSIGSMCYLLFAYEEFGGLSGLATKAIQPKYYQAAKDFYEFKIGFLDLLQKTTPNLLEFLNPEFVEELRLGSSPLCQAMNTAESYRWRSNTPLRSYYGEKDEAIPVELAKLAVEYQQSMGKKNGEAILAGPNADHRATYIKALYEAKPWFDGFIKK
jgi:pimeloyl-ACP methyl ester carboxylesterase